MIATSASSGSTIAGQTARCRAVDQTRCRQYGQTWVSAGIWDAMVLVPPFPFQTCPFALLMTIIPLGFPGCQYMGCQVPCQITWRPAQTPCCLCLWLAKPDSESRYSRAPVCAYPFACVDKCGICRMYPVGDSHSVPIFPQNARSPGLGRFAPLSL